MSTLILASLGAFLASSLGALLPGERKSPSSLPVWGCAAAAVLGLIPTVSVLAGAPPVDLALPWGLPGTWLRWPIWSCPCWAWVMPNTRVR